MKNYSKPSPINNFNFDEVKVKEFKSIYPTTKNNDLAIKYSLTSNQIVRWGQRLRLNKSKILRGQINRLKKTCIDCLEDKEIARSYKDGSDKCIKCEKKSLSRWDDKQFNPLKSTRTSINLDAPEWWIEANRKLMVIS